MRRAFLLLLLFLSAGFMQAQDFAQLVDKVHAAPESRRQYLVDSFLTLVGSFPHIENDSSVYMLYLGNATGVFLAGDANGWSAKTSPLTRLSTTNLWYREERYEADARLDYKIVVDDRWLLDPRNPYTVSGGYGPNSELRMPSYIPPSEIIPNNVASRGTLVDTSVSSTALGNLRPIRIYLPPGYDQGSDRYPVALFHDGMNYLTLAHAATVLDNLIHEGRIPPVIAVFIPPVDPTSEYAGNKLEA
ncbi:MAG: hypothetical protein JXA28_07840, partial [Bacteroidetes bacterium]|nr:hypothetical protein [Bacteroidota bacterium]